MPSAQHLDIPTVNDHMPGLLDDLATELKLNSESTFPELVLEDSTPARGLQRRHDLVTFARYGEGLGKIDDEIG